MLVHIIYIIIPRHQNGGRKLRAEADKPVLKQEYWLVWTADANADDFTNHSESQQLFKPRLREGGDFISRGRTETKGRYFRRIECFSQQQKKKWEPISRFTKLFTDDNSPWKQAPQVVKNLYTPQEIESNSFKFPQDLEKCLPVVNRLAPNAYNKYIFNCCCCPVGSSEYESTSRKITSYFFCYNCHRSQHESGSGRSFSFGICEGCFEPSQHSGHYYEKKNYCYLDKLICICGKDMFLGNPPVFRCSKHRQSTEQKENEGLVNKNMQQWPEMLRIFQSLFSIMFYLQKEMYGFPQFQNEQATCYFESMRKVIEKIIEICKTDGELMKEILQFLCNTQVKVVKDQSQNGFGNYNRSSGKQQTFKIMSYLMNSFQNEDSFKQLLLLFLTNDKIAENFIQRITSEQKENRYIRLGDKPQLQLILRSNIAERSLLKSSTYFWRAKENQKIIWLKCQKNYDYALKFIRQTVYPSRSQRYITCNEYANNMDQIVTAFNEIGIGKFLKHVGPCLLPQLLNCFRRFYVESEFDDYQQADEDEARSTRRTWQNHKEIVVGIINRTIVSLCGGRVENLPNFKVNLRQIQANFTIDEQSIQYMDKEKQKLLKVKEITENFIIYCKQYSKFYRNDWNSSSFNRNEKVGLQYEKDLDKYKNQKHMEKLMRLFMPTFDYFESETTAQAISNLCKIGQRNGSFNQNLSYRRNRDEIGKKVQRKRVYEILGLIMFYDFHVPELCYNELKSQSEVQQHRIKIEELFIYYLINKKTFSPYQLHVLNKKLQIPNFLDFVVKHLIYNYQTKKYFYNEVQLLQFPDLPIYQLLWNFSSAYDGLIGQKCVEKIQKYINTDLQKDILCKIFVDSELIKQQKSFLDRVIGKFGQVQGEQHVQLVNHYGFYLSYLIIGEVVERLCKKQNTIIYSELKKLREDEQYRYRFSMTEQEKSEVDELLFGKCDRNQTVVAQDMILESQIQIKDIPQKEKEHYLSKKEQKNKEFHQKRQKLLFPNELAPQTATETCIVCHSGPVEQNPLIYPMHVNINKTVPSAFFSTVNKMRTNIKSCFHPLHLACYRQKRGQNSCPLCSQTNFKPQEAMMESALSA